MGPATWQLGGLGYTDQLPVSDYDGEHVRPQDIWGRCDTQEFSVVSLDQYWEFAMQYQSLILAGFGLTVIGCCEAMDGKYKYLRNIPNARRVSGSPWGTWRRRPTRWKTSTCTLGD